MTTVAAAKKSTNVRFVEGVMSVLDPISPALAGRIGWAVFSTPGTPRPSEWVRRPDQTQWLRWEGLHLAVHCWEAHGPTVLLVHGWHGRASDLSAMAEPLRARGYRVVAVDFPAHGASTGRRTILPKMAAALKAVAAMQPSLHAVIAHSFGGIVTAVALRQGLAVERVVLLASPSDMEPYFATLERALGMGPRGRQAFRQRLARVLGRAGVPGLDVTAMVADLRIPALIVHSTDDREVPVASSRRLAQAWAGSERMQVEGLGHRRLLRNPAVVSHVVDFVAPVPRAVRTPPERPLRIAAGGA
jgi:pimeloyl-ACP methyl ester carboxylesterase